MNIDVRLLKRKTVLVLQYNTHDSSGSVVREDEISPTPRPMELSSILDLELIFQKGSTKLPP